MPSRPRLIQRTKEQATWLSKVDLMQYGFVQLGGMVEVSTANWLHPAAWSPMDSSFN